MKKILHNLHLLLFFVFLYLIYYFLLKNSTQGIVPITNNGSPYLNKKDILLWNILPGKMTSILKNNSFADLGCEFTACSVVSDRRTRAVSSYDAVVFNMNVLHYAGELPWLTQNYSRSKNQRFIFFSQEPPMYIFTCISIIPINNF